MKGLRVEESNVLMLGPGVTWDDDEPGRQAGVVGQQLSGAGQTRVHQQSRLQGERRERRHVEDVVVFQEEKVVGVVEAIDVMHLVLEEVPASVKLVDGQRWFRLGTRLQCNAHKTLKRG